MMRFIKISILEMVIFVLVLVSSFNSDHALQEQKEVIDKQEDIVDVDNTKDDQQAKIDLDIVIEPNGEVIYDSGSNYGYRYGPTMLINDDGSIDAWFARPGNNGSSWDYICYRHMDVDNNWSDEKIVLWPTPGSKDCYSVCDPGVIYFDGYYYIGYTGTNSSDGLRNQIFVARSTEPDGSYEKWNGSSWGGNPEPIVSYDGEYWGVGEISFVLQNGENKMFCYYSYKDLEEDSVRCSKVDLSPDWPSSIRYKRISYSNSANECSSDVVYLKDKDIYLSFSIGNRMSEKSNLLVYYSLNGKSFELYDEYDDEILEFAHNMGISKHLDGHIESSDDLYIAYAYSADNKWGRWKTYMQKIYID